MKITLVYFRQFCTKRIYNVYRRLKFKIRIIDTRMYAAFFKLCSIRWLRVKKLKSQNERGRRGNDCSFRCSVQYIGNIICIIIYRKYPISTFSFDLLNDFKSICVATSRADQYRRNRSPMFFEICEIMYGYL